MIWSINTIYQAKVSEINNRINSNLNSMTGNFKACFDEAVRTCVNQTPASNITNIPAANSSTKYSAKKTDYDGIISEKASKYGVSEKLIKAVIQAESGFNPNAASGAGAQGLMQLMPATAAGLGVTDPFDPEQNIDGGVRYLKGQLDRFGGDVKLALAAYNCGPYRVLNLKLNDLNDPSQLAKLPAETQNYVRKIFEYIN